MSCNPITVVFRRTYLFTDVLQKVVNTNFTYLLMFPVLLLLPVIMNGQVQKVQYYLAYNESTCLFDMHIIVKQGQATSIPQRTQLNAQISLVVPTGSNVSIERRYMPLQNNQNYSGTDPMVWQLASTIISPEAQPESDFYSIIPTLSPTSFYNNIATNDTIRLFSLAVSPVTECGKGVRIFQNGVDPGPSAAGMFGSNFSNGFTLGGLTNRYDGNAQPKSPVRPQISLLQSQCNDGIDISLETTEPSACHGPLTYEWNGPEGYKHYEKDVFIENSGPLQNGWYHISIVDSLGCTTKDSIMAFSKPKGGSDKTVSCYLTGKTTLKAQGSGEWLVDTLNPGTLVLTHPQSLITGVSSFSAPGDYLVFRSSGVCQDTVVIHVGENCACAVENELTLPDDYSFCNQISDITLEGNEVDTAGTYEWFYSVNNAAFTIAPGISNQKNYKTNILSVGEHTFKRVFYPLAIPGCSDTSNTVIILVSPSLSAGSDAELFCFETDTAYVEATGTGYWKVLPTSVAMMTLQQYGNPDLVLHSFELPGDYHLSWTNDVCSDTVTIVANPYCGCFEANAGRDTSACAGSDLILQGSCIVGTWHTANSNPTGTQILSDTLGMANIRFSAGASGEYRFIYTVFDTLVDTIKVLVHQRPTINVGEDFAFCEGSPPVLIVAGGGISYIWSTQQTTANIMVSPSQTTTYHVTGFNNVGCSNTDSITVTILPRPAGSIPSIPMVPEGSNVELNSGVWTDAEQFIWQGPGNFIATEQNPMISNIRKNQEGMYQLTIISPDECMSVSSVMIMVDERVLPLYLTNLQAVYDKNNHQNIISWDIEALINHDYIIVERALEGEDFEPLETIYPNGNTGKYEVFDSRISFNKLYQYRLLSVDIDGQKEYFGPVRVKTDRQNTRSLTAQLFPVPATERIFLSVNPILEKNIFVSVYNNEGTLIYKTEVYESNSSDVLEDFNVQQQKSGSYLVMLESGNDTLVLSFIISH
jgi:hypothetical protein